MDWSKTTARRDKKHLSVGIWCVTYIRGLTLLWVTETAIHVSPFFQAALDCALAYSKDRTAFGAPIAKMQAIQVSWIWSKLEVCYKLLMFIWPSSLQYMYWRIGVKQNPSIHIHKHFEHQWIPLSMNFLNVLKCSQLMKSSIYADKCSMKEATLWLLGNWTLCLLMFFAAVGHQQAQC